MPNLKRLIIFSIHQEKDLNEIEHQKNVYGLKDLCALNCAFENAIVENYFVDSTFSFHDEDTISNIIANYTHLIETIDYDCSRYCLIIFLNNSQMLYYEI